MKRVDNKRREMWSRRMSIFYIPLLFGAYISIAGCPLKESTPSTTPTEEESLQIVSTKWARTANSASGDSIFYSVSVDSSGSIYAAGYCVGTGSYDFGNGVNIVGSDPQGNALLVKYNSSGEAQWAATTILSTTSTILYSTAVDSTGNICAAGYYGSYVLLSKLNSIGVEQWFRTSTGGVAQFKSIAVDSSGNTYAVGEINGYDVCDFGNGVTAIGAYSSNYNVVLVKYDASGNAQWARTVTSASDESFFNSIALDSSGNIYAAGYIQGTNSYNFGNGITVTGAYEHLVYSSPNILLVKYDSSGTALWARSVASASGYSTCTSIAVDTSGNIYAAAQIVGPADYDFGDGVTFTPPTDPAVYGVMLKYDTSGKTQWAKVFSTNEILPPFFSSVLTDDSDNIYAAGSYSNGVALLVKYDSSGTVQWYQNAVPSTKSSHFQSIAIDSSSNIYAAGNIQSTASFDFRNGVTIAGPYSGNNIVLVKY